MLCSFQRLYRGREREREQAKMQNSRTRGASLPLGSFELQKYTLCRNHRHVTSRMRADKRDNRAYLRLLYITNYAHTHTSQKSVNKHAHLTRTC